MHIEGVFHWAVVRWLECFVVVGLGNHIVLEVLEDSKCLLYAESMEMLA